MAATRLNKNLRMSILSVLMKRAYLEWREQIELMEHSIAIEVYNEAYDPEIQEQMKKLPAVFFKETKYVSAAFNGEYYQLELPEEMPVGNHHISWMALFNYPGDHKLTEMFTTFIKLKKEYDEACQRLRAEAYTILESCPTTKKLLEVWPEIDPVLKELNLEAVQSSKIYLPAVVQDINHLFHLEKEVSDKQDDVLAAA